jgi:hypothetical protein
MTKGSPTITIRLRGDLKARLTEAARGQGETVTQVAERLLLEWTNAFHGVPHHSAQPR